ncbi:glycosyltransferase family 4 protein [Marine Group I thaumarchaeote]|jgi:glycosyltransferase involved in cell wall biosynthesis|uniref:Glycosyltransferase family 4 protein n=1 Tax=Marine Group I thaumarchaeote TaxID=2511932 RepID=A0A7K4NQJ9_9ARCH|nr:glycosyltransferase family 4 protein [Marine Group I thaumarchaeote]
MKIALVCPASLPATQFGGIVFLAVDLAQEISEMGHNVTIYTTDLDFSNGSNKFNKKLPRIEKFGKFLINRTHVWFSLKLFFVNTSMSKEIENDKPDIIHTIGLRSFQSIIAWRVSKKLNIPLVVSDQGGLTTHPFLAESGFFLKTLYKIQDFFIKKIINDASVISVANEYEQKIFSSLNKKSRIEIIRNGVNLKKLVSKHNFKEKYQINSNFILFVGRFSKSKGIETLINAFSIVKNELKDSNIHLVIMGVDFGYQAEMEKLIKKLNLSEEIKVIKNPPRDDVISAYGESEFLVLPSQWELSPLVPLESFAFKKPVISTNSHGIPYTVQNNKNGILVEPENSLELSNAIVKLLNDSELREKLGQSGYNFVNEECNCVSMAKNSLKLYEDILEEMQNELNNE